MINLQVRKPGPWKVFVEVSGCPEFWKDTGSIVIPVVHIVHVQHLINNVSNLSNFDFNTAIVVRALPMVLQQITFFQLRSSNLVSSKIKIFVYSNFQ